MNIFQVHTDDAPQAIGPYSQAVSFKDLVFCSGQIPLLPETMIIEGLSVKEQTQQVLKNLAAVLEAAGSHPSKILKTTVFITNLAAFNDFNQVYGAFLETHGVRIPPARSTIEVSALPKGALIEIEAIAVKA